MVIPGQNVDQVTQEELAAGLAGKANTVHTHAISDVTGLSSALSDRVTNAALTAALAAYLPLAGGVVSNLVSFSGTTHAGIRLNNLTTAQRNAIASPGAGSFFWNTTDGRVNVHNGTGWTNGFARIDGDTFTGNVTIPTIFVGASSGPRIDNNSGTVRFQNNAGSSLVGINTTGLHNPNGQLTFRADALGILASFQYASAEAMQINFNAVQIPRNIPLNFIDADNSAGGSPRATIIPGTGSTTTLDLRAQTGVRIQNLAGTADAPISCGSILASGLIKVASASPFLEAQHTIYSVGLLRLGVNNSNVIELRRDALVRMQSSNTETTIFGSDQSTFLRASNSTAEMKAQLGGRFLIDVFFGANDFAFLSHSGNRIASIHANAPASSLVINSSGHANFGGNLTASGWIDGAHRPFTFAGLPLASASTNKTFVCTDSTLAMSGANYGTTPAGGGSNRVKVFSNGTNWVIG